ncbi:unnamed protein product [Arabidopsis halleri]
MSSNSSCSLLILLSLLLIIDLTAARSCPETCGGIGIPYPFGIGVGCYLEKWYEIVCVNNSVPFLSIINKEVVSISFSDMYRRFFDVGYGLIRIKNPITSKGCSSGGQELGSLLNLTGYPFYLGDNNMLIAVGCNNTASLTNVEPSIVGCESTCSRKQQMPINDYLGVVYCNTKSRGSEFCNKISTMNDTSCNGTGCCKAGMPDRYQQIIGVEINDNNTQSRGCKVAFLTDEEYFLSNGSDPERLHANGYVTVELRWFIHTANDSFIGSLGCKSIEDFTILRRDNAKVDGVGCLCDYNSTSYATCSCSSGYEGNPYLPGECKDINECVRGIGGEQIVCPRGKCVNLQGDYRCEYTNHRPLVIGISTSFSTLIFICGIYWLYKFIRRQRRLNQKKKFFKRNGGLLLQQQLTSTEGNVDSTRVFNSRELEKATENFSFNRILGEGGQGTVYKGMLVDGRIVAVKKSKVVDEDKLEEFINEVVILSQINHRNIVKLLGCCLETDVPILVYEFIPNGNLFEHLHDDSDDYTMATWDVRLRIALDIAGALSYLHSAASSPIYHRDVKSTNIMLNEKYRAKVSDFGTSRTVTVDHTHLTTVVSGTVGYMDPEYFQSSQFTDKSDVYSFGVVLAELITGEKSVSFLRSQESRTLATYFNLAMKENRLSDIIDARIRDGCKLNQVTAAAKIARKCLNMKGRKRPSMREVSMELEKICSYPEDMLPYEYVSENEEEKEEKLVEVIESRNYVTAAAPSSQYSIATSSSSCSDVEPLFPLQTR